MNPTPPSPAPAGPRPPFGLPWIVVVLGGALLFVVCFHVVGTFLPGADSPPTARHVSQFLDQFWAQVVATILGIALGVPVGLLLDRRARAREESNEKTRRHARITEIATLLTGSLEHNQAMVTEIGTNVGNGLGFLELGFDRARWAMVSDEASRLFSSADLVGELAHIYEELDGLERLVLLHRDYEIGHLSTVPGAATVLPQLLAAVQRNASEIKTKIDEVLPRLRPLAAPPA